MVEAILFNTFPLNNKINGKFLKKSVKGETTYANALIKSQRLDQKISETSMQKVKKGNYYTMIYIELEKN